MAHINLRKARLNNLHALNAQVRTLLGLYNNEYCELLIDLDQAHQLNAARLEELRQIMISNVARVKRITSPNFGHSVYA